MMNALMNGMIPSANSVPFCNDPPVMVESTLKKSLVAKVSNAARFKPGTGMKQPTLYINRMRSVISNFTLIPFTAKALTKFLNILFYLLANAACFFNSGFSGFAKASGFYGKGLGKFTVT